MILKREYLTNNFDAVRLFGALQVVLANHYASHFELGLDMSFWSIFRGVPIFFFLAGIFIPMSFEKHPNIVQYMKNRLLKIFPVMWCSILLAIALMFLSGFRPDTSVPKFLEWLGVYALYPLYTPEWLRPYGVGAINGALWIIPAQITFYIFVPVIYSGLKLGGRSPLWIIAIFFALAACKFGIFDILNSAGISNSSIISKTVSTSFLVHFPMFIIGMFFYSKFEFFYRLVKGRFLLFLALHICLSLAVSHFGGDASTLASANGFWKYPLMITLALCVFSAGYSMPSLSDSILRRKDISYGLYVYHMPVANFVLYTCGTGLTNAFTAFAATVAVSIFSYVFIESKFLGMKKYSVRTSS